MPLGTEIGLDSDSVSVVTCLRENKNQIYFHHLHVVGSVKGLVLLTALSTSNVISTYRGGQVFLAEETRVPGGKQPSFGK